MWKFAQSAKITRTAFEEMIELNKQECLLPYIRQSILNTGKLTKEQHAEINAIGAKAKIQKDKQAQNKGKKNFDSATVEFKYALNETLVNKQNEKAKADLERQKKKEEDEKKMKNQSYIFQGINNPNDM